MPDISTHLDEVGEVASALADLGLEPVLVGGMALVIIGSRRVTRDFDFVTLARLAQTGSRDQSEAYAGAGCRTLDVLQVATAIELGLPAFVTFDRRQQRLARTMGLSVLVPRS